MSDVLFDAVEQAEEVRELWSVTTLIKAALGVGEPIVGWAARVTAERAYDRQETLAMFAAKDDRGGAIEWLTRARYEATKEAQERGSAVHRELEGHALGGDLQRVLTGEPLPDEIEPFAEQLRKFIDDHRPVFKLSEAPVYHPTIGYAGTLDGIVELASFPGRNLLIDMKTTAKPPKSIDPSIRSRPPYPEIALQLVAYRKAELVGLSPASMVERSRRRYYAFDPSLDYAPMPETAGALALIVSPWDYRLIPVKTGPEIWKIWAYAVEMAKWTIDVSKDVFGPEVGPS